MNNVSAIDVGKFFYDKNNNFTSKQIQKLTYYSYVWYMIKYKNENKKIFEEKPQAWIHGPVFNSLYASMRSGVFFSHQACSFEEDVKEILELVYKIYGKYTGNQLEKMTHQDDPWIKARGDLESYEPSRMEISDRDILEYYS